MSTYFYFQIESLDDNSGRLLIKLTLGGTKDWFNEFMVQAVSKAEYAQYAKVLSNSKKGLKLDENLILIFFRLRQV